MSRRWNGCRRGVTAQRQQGGGMSKRWNGWRRGVTAQRQQGGGMSKRWNGWRRGVTAQRQQGGRMSRRWNGCRGWNRVGCTEESCRVLDGWGLGKGNSGSAERQQLIVKTAGPSQDMSKYMIFIVWKALMKNMVIENVSLFLWLQ